MNRASLLIVLLGLGLAAPAAQGAVVFGLKGGIDYANLSMDNDQEDPEYLLGFGGGLTLGTPIQSGVGIDLDILFLRKGCKHEYTSGLSIEEQTLTIETRIDYIVVSPLLRFSPGADGAGIYFLGGPEVGYLLQAESSAEGGAADEAKNTDITEEFKEIDFGVSFGLGFQTASADGGGFLIESRYALGLADINDTDQGPEIGTRGIYLFAGLRF